MRRIAVLKILTLLTLGLFLSALPVQTARADGESSEGPITVISAEVITEFPEGIRFKLQAESEAAITTAAVRFRSTAQTSGVFEYLDHRGGSLIDGELFWRTNNGARYIPPGTLLQVRFEVQDSAGNFFETDEQDFVYNDSRFAWEEVSEGPITVAYHGPVKTRAENVLSTILDTLEFMGPLLGADTSIPIRVTLYNNNREMLGALPPRSQAIGRELITEGQAFSDFNTLLLLGSGRLSLGTAGHEVIHILTHRAGDSIFRTVPSWLDEGLAEFGNPEPGFSYDIALEFAVETDSLMPVVYMQGLPGDPEEVIIFYGQARSIVRFLILRYGAGTMRNLMTELQGGARMDLALEQVYGFDQEELDRQWREAIGAPEYVPPEQGGVRPTPLPLPSLQMYSLTPQPAASADDEPEATESSEADVDENSAEPESLASLGTSDEPTAASEAAPIEQNVDEGEPTGGGCNGPSNGASGMMDLSAVALALGLLGMALRRRFLKR